MKAIELFAGAGGAALGLGAAGFEHLALCEWDPDACATLRAAGLGPVVEGDVRDLDAIEAVAGPSCDLLWSSFPCQAFSTAGKRLGAGDERNGWPWTVDAIDRLKPAWFLGENVRGLLMHRGDCTARGGQLGIFGTAPPEDCPGCYFERRVLPDLRERFAFVGWWLLDAADYGVPQHRRRVILWAGPAPVVKPVPTHGPARALPRVSMGEALGIDGEIHTQRSPETAKGGNKWAHSDGPAPTIVSAVPPHYRPALLVGSGMKGSEWGIGRPAPTHGPGRALPWVGMGEALGLSDFLVDPERGAGMCERHGERPFTTDKDPAPTIRARSRGAPPLTVVGSGMKGPAYLLSPSPTVTTTDGVGLGSASARDYMEAATERRRLAVEECAILQDFPADHPWQGNSQARYRQVGNAVPPTLARVVGEAVMRAAR